MDYKKNEKSKQIKVVLVSLYNKEPIGLRSIYSFLVKNGFNIKLIFLGEDNRNRKELNYKLVPGLTQIEVDGFLKLLKTLTPDIIGFSLVSSIYNRANKLINKIRKNLDSRIIVGGIHATMNPKQCLEIADIVCLGEGEVPFLELVERLAQGKKIYDIKNLWIKETNEKIIKNVIRSPLKELDSLEHIISKDDSYVVSQNGVIQEDPYSFNHRYSIMTMRGCPFNCSFCSNNFLDKLYGNFQIKNRPRYRSVNHIIKEIKYVKSKLGNISQINFYDEIFFPATVNFNEFCQKYKQEIGLPFFIQIHPGNFSDERAKRLKDIGLKGVWCGLQSGSAKIRRNIFYRKYSNNKVLSTANILNKYNISVRYDFIFNNPFDDLSTMRETINLMMELPSPYTANLFSLSFFPFTDITKMALSHGHIKTDDIEGINDSSLHHWHVRLNLDDDKKALSDHDFINTLAKYIVYNANLDKISKDKITTYWDHYLEKRDCSELVKQVRKIVIIQRSLSNRLYTTLKNMVMLH